MAKKKLTTDEVKHVAKLANLPLTEAEVADFQEKLSYTLDYVDILKEVETSGVEPSFHPTGEKNHLREDEAKPSLSQEEALRNAKKAHNGFFVAKVVWD